LIFDEEVFVTEMLAFLDPHSPEGELSQKQMDQIHRMWLKSQGETIEETFE